MLRRPIISPSCIDLIIHLLLEQVSEWVQSGHVTRPHPSPSQSLKQIELFCQWVVILLEDYVIML